MTRIEGHAKISIFLDDDGKVTDAQFHVVEFRGFEKFCEGRPLWEMPGITARICGICPVSHLLASAKAGDAIMAVNIPPAADKLRRLMNLGQLIQSHALSFFHLSAPDFLLGWDGRRPGQAQYLRFDRRPIRTWPAPASACGSSARRSSRCSAARRSTRRGRCPAACAAAFHRGPRAHQAGLPEACATTQLALDLFKKLARPDHEEVQIFGNFPSLFMGLVAGTATWEHHGGKLRFIDSRGNIIADQLDAQDYQDYIGEAVQPIVLSQVARTTSRWVSPTACTGSARWRGSTCASSWARRRRTPS